MNHVDNIIFHYLDATEDELHAGMTWYSEANELARSLSPDNVWRGAGVIAAYSPLTPWWRNRELAIDSLTTGIANPKSLPHSVKCAQLILDGLHPLEVFKGDKTRAFASAIAEPENSTIATIDRHAYNLAMGTMEGNPTIGKRIFRTLSDAYIESANLAGISVAQMQAIAWVVFRRRKGLS